MIVEPEQPDKLAEAILHLQKNPAEAEALGLQGRRYAVLNYSFEQALSRYEELFYQITEATRRTALPGLTTEDVLTEAVPVELEKTQV
jgi:colanic acid biosynthesis glycosyl transferase WcaI